MISIIVPARNEASVIVPQLMSLAPFRRAGGEVIVVDGMSVDGTPELARPYADQVLTAPAGRAIQMNAGASRATGQVLLFLHADTTLPGEALRTLETDLARSGRVWGRFDVEIVSSHPILPLVAWSMNVRSRLSGIATGDQGIFVRREVFERCGCYPAIRLMEDIALSRRLRRESAPLCVRERARTSGRRWQEHGVARTIGLMWQLRLRYFLGADPEELAARYGYNAQHE